MDKIKNFIESEKLGKTIENASFKEYTTIKVGGKIRLIFLPNSIDSFIIFYRFALKNNVDVLVLGNGSNILASDEEYEGVVVLFSDINILYYSVGNNYYVYPGCQFSKLGKQLIALGYKDSEYFMGIPATIGGMVFMNAGCFGKSIGDYVLECLVIDKNGEMYFINKNKMEFSYRDSIFKKMGLVILLVKILFPKSNDIDEVKNRYKYLMSKKKASQPINAFSAGCAFKNLIDKPAWKIINELGFSGYKIGGAEVSKLHNNFLINTGNATGQDFYDLINLIKAKAKNNSIILENEYLLINFKKKY